MINLTDIQLPHSVRFAEKWQEWLVFRKEIKKPYKTDRGVKMALNTLKAVSEQEAIEMIDNSIRNEYQGLFPQKKEKEETPKVYIQPKPKELSTYQPEPYPREKGLDHMRDKLRKNYENGSYIKDWGNIYTNLLREKCGMVASESIVEEISAKVHHEANRKRNRFEEPFTGSIWAEIRDQYLNHFLDECRANNRDLSLEI